MPRGKNTRSINTNVSASEYEFIRDTLAGNEGIAAYIRRLIEEDKQRREAKQTKPLP